MASSSVSGSDADLENLKEEEISSKVPSNEVIAGGCVENITVKIIPPLLKSCF
jgi:hypothetical protein